MKIPRHLIKVWLNKRAFGVQNAFEPAFKEIDCSFCNDTENVNAFAGSFRLWGGELVISYLQTCSFRESLLIFLSFDEIMILRVCSMACMCVKCYGVILSWPSVGGPPHKPGPSQGFSLLNGRFLCLFLEAQQLEWNERLIGIKIMHWVNWLLLKSWSKDNVLIFLMSLVVFSALLHHLFDAMKSHDWCMIKRVGGTSSHPAWVFI